MEENLVFVEVDLTQSILTSSGLSSAECSALIKRYVELKQFKLIAREMCQSDTHVFCYTSAEFANLLLANSLQFICYSERTTLCTTARNVKV